MTRILSASVANNDERTTPERGWLRIFFLQPVDTDYDNARSLLVPFDPRGRENVLGWIPGTRQPKNRVGGTRWVMLHPPQRGSTGWEGEQPRWLVANIPPVFCLQRRTAYGFPLCDWNYISLHLRAFAFDAVILPRFAFVEIALTTNSPVWVRIVIVLDVWCFDEQIFGFVEICWSWCNWENIVNTWNIMFLSNSNRCSIHNCTPIMIILDVWCFGRIFKVRRCSNRKLIIIEHSACRE